MLLLRRGKIWREIELSDGLFQGFRSISYHTWSPLELCLLFAVSFTLYRSWYPVSVRCYLYVKRKIFHFFLFLFEQIFDFLNIPPTFLNVRTRKCSLLTHIFAILESFSIHYSWKVEIFAGHAVRRRFEINIIDFTWKGKLLHIGTSISWSLISNIALWSRSNLSSQYPNSIVNLVTMNFFVFIFEISSSHTFRTVCMKRNTFLLEKIEVQIPPGSLIIENAHFTNIWKIGVNSKVVAS